MGHAGSAFHQAGRVQASLCPQKVRIQGGSRPLAVTRTHLEHVDGEHQVGRTLVHAHIVALLLAPALEGQEAPEEVGKGLLLAGSG